VIESIKARALVGGVPANVRDLSRCPICGEPRYAETRQARDEQVRALLLAALALMGKNEQP